MHKIHRIICVIMGLILLIQPGLLAADGQKLDAYYNTDQQEFDDYDKRIQGETVLNAPAGSVYVSEEISEELLVTAASVETAAERIRFLNTVGVLDTEQAADATVSRGDFALLLANILGGKELSGAFAGTTFPDVPIDHYASESINFIYVTGIMGGYANNTFMPQKPLEYYEAITSLVRSLGYDERGKALGGYPGGYIAAAQELSMLKGVSARAGQSVVTIGALAVMIDNILEKKMVDNYLRPFNQTLILGSGEKTLLHDFLKLYKREGVVTAVKNLDLYGTNTPLSKNHIKIMGEAFDAAASGAEQFFGKKIVYYIPAGENAAQPVIQYAALKQGVSQERLDAASINSAASSDRMIVCEETEKTQRLSIKEGAKVLKNGIPVMRFSPEILPANGTVTLICNDSFGAEYDVVLITELKSFVIDRVIDEKISFKYGATVTVDGNAQSFIELDPRKYSFSITKEGRFIDVGALSEWSALSLSYNETIGFIIEYSDDYVNGAIEALVVAPHGVMVGGRQLEIDPDYQALVDRRVSGTQKLTLGLEGTFILDFSGRVVGVKAASQREQDYGYLLALGKSKGLDSYLQVKMVSSSSDKVFALDVDKKPILNGSTVTTAVLEAALQAIIAPHAAELPENADLRAAEIERRRNEPPLIRYKLSGGRIKEIVSNIVPYSEEEKPDPDTNIVRLQNSANLIYRPDRHNFKAQIYLNNTTSVFEVPDTQKEEDYKSGGYGLIPAVDNVNYDVVAFDCDNFRTASLLLKFSGGGGGGNVNEWADPMVVMTVSDAINADGEIRKKVSGMVSGRNVEYVTSDSEAAANTLQQVKKGDIIQLGLNARQEITGIRLCVSYGVSRYEITREGDRGERIFALVKEVSTTMMNLQLGDGKVHYIPANITVFDGERCYLGTAIDIIPGAEVFVMAIYDSAQSMVVYKK